MAWYTRIEFMDVMTALSVITVLGIFVTLFIFGGETGRWIGGAFSGIILAFLAYQGWQHFRAKDNTYTGQEANLPTWKSE